MSMSTPTLTIVLIASPYSANAVNAYIDSLGCSSEQGAWELIVVAPAGEDAQAQPSTAPEEPMSFLSVRWIAASGSSPIEACNEAIATARGDFLHFAYPETRYSGRFLEDSIASLRETGLALASASLCPDECGAGEHTRLDRGLPDEEATIDLGQTPTAPRIYLESIVFQVEALRAQGLTFAEGVWAVSSARFVLRALAIDGSYAWMPHCEVVSAHKLEDGVYRGDVARDPAWYYDWLEMASGLGFKTQVADAEGATIALEAADRTCPPPSLADRPFVQFAMLYLFQFRLLANKQSAAKFPFVGEELHAFLAAAGKVFEQIDDDILYAPVKSIALSKLELTLIDSWRGERFRTKPFLDWAPEERNAEERGIEEQITEEQTSEKPTVRKQGIYRVTSQGKRVFVRTLRSDPHRIDAMKPLLEDGRLRALELYVRVETMLDAADYELWAIREDRHGESHAFLGTQTELYTAVEYFGEPTYRLHMLHFEIPILAAIEQRIRFEVRTRLGAESVSLSTSVRWHTRLARDVSSSYWEASGHIVTLKKGALLLRPSTEELRAACHCALVEEMNAKADIGERYREIIENYWRDEAELDAKGGSGIWVYFDRRETAGDNGDLAWRYALAQDDGVEKVFLIGKKSEYFSRLREIPGSIVVDTDSPEAFWYVVHASCIVATHYPVNKYIGLHERKLRWAKGFLSPMVVRLYHGFMTSAFDWSYRKIHDDTALNCTYSEFEKNRLIDSQLGYGEQSIAITGMPRFDTLSSRDKKMIMFSPTWRRYLRTGTATYNPDFKDSAYCKIYNGLINDERLIAAAKQYGYEIVLFLHPCHATQIRDFTCSDPAITRVVCSSMPGVTYDDYLRDASLMVTDVSSIFFDFAYMHKPLIYYRDPALPTHRELVFDVWKQGFGEVVDNPGELIDLVIDYMKKGCALKPFYDARAREFFPAMDHNNAKRVYEAMRSYLESHEFVSHRTIMESQYDSESIEKAEQAREHVSLARRLRRKAGKLKRALKSSIKPSQEGGAQ